MVGNLDAPEPEHSSITKTSARLYDRNHAQSLSEFQTLYHLGIRDSNVIKPIEIISRVHMKLRASPNWAGPFFDLIQSNGHFAAGTEHAPSAHAAPVAAGTAAVDVAAGVLLFTTPPNNCPR